MFDEDINGGFERCFLFVHGGEQRINEKVTANVSVGA